MSLDAINWVAKQKAGNATAKHVLLWLAFHANGRSGECFPSVHHPVHLSAFRAGVEVAFEKAFCSLDKANFTRASNEKQVKLACKP